jgi:hypothetical protein
LNDQYHVSTKQYEIINTLYSIKDFDFIVVDGSLLLGLYYNKTYKTNVSNIEKTHEMITRRNDEFKHVYVYLERNKSIPFEEIGRVHTMEESLKIDKDLLDMMVEMGVNFKSFVSDPNNVSDIIDYILGTQMNSIPCNLSTSPPLVTG